MNTRKALLSLIPILICLAGSTAFSKEGDILWQRTVGENIEATPAVDLNGNIYTTGGGYVWSFTKDGELRWKTCPLDEEPKGLEQEYPYPLSNSSSPAVSPDGQSVYVTGYAGAFAFRTRDGKVLWKKTVFDNYYEFSEKEYAGQARMWKKTASKGYPQIFATTPAISADGTRLYAGAGDNDFQSDSFFCIDAEDGSLIWQYVNPHPPQQESEEFVTEVHPEEEYVRGYLGGASLGPDGTVYVASMHGWLISLTDNGDSYTENWAYNVGAEMRMPPSMDAKGFLYVGSSSAGGYIHKVDSRTGKKAPGKWPVKTTAREVFANIAIASDGTVYANSEDHRLWAFNPDGTVKWNNLKFEHWGGDPLIRADDRVIVTSQLDKAARVVCIRDDGDKGVVEWFSDPITTELAFNETNVNIAPDGDIYVTSGVESPHALFAIEGNGMGLSKTSPWPKFMGGIQNNGNASTPAKDGTIKWSRKIRGIVLKGGLALGPDGTIYAATTEGFVYGVNPDGTVKWEMDLNPKEVRPEDMPPQLKEVPSGIDVRDIPDSIVIPDSALEGDNFSHASPTLTPDGKRLYVAGHTSGKIYCIDTATGSVIWFLNVREIPEVKNDPFHYGGGFVSSPAIGADGTIYIGSGDWWGDQWAEALRMGIDFKNVVKRRWSDRRLYAANPDGILKWTFLIEETDTHRTSIFGCPAIGADGTIYFGAFNGIFYALKDEGDNARELWRHEVKGEPLSTAPTKYQEFWGSAAIAADGTIYVGNNDYHVYAFDRDGSIKWKFKTGNEVYQSVTIGGDGTVYIASEDRNLYALNPDDGAKKWSYRPEVRGIPFTASVTEDETVIFGLSGPNEVIALDGNTGDMKWQCTLHERRSDGTCTDPVIGPDGTIYMFGMNAIHAIKGSSPLSSRSPWPKVNRDNRNTGRAY